MLNLAMISVLNRPHELKAHIRGALTNGVTRAQICEVLLQVAIYAGVPAAVDSFPHRTRDLRRNRRGRMRARAREAARACFASQESSACDMLTATTRYDAVTAKLASIPRGSTT